MFNNKIRSAAAGIAAFAIAISAMGPAGIASASSLNPAAVNGPVTCSIQTVNGHYVTAVGGGGRTTDVIHTDAVRVGSWELFTLIDSGDGSAFVNYGFQTHTGNFLTVVGGGGRITDVIHSDATRLLGWEKITPISFGNGWYALRTLNGNYLTAVGGGGRTTDTIHSDATVVRSWELFQLNCKQFSSV